MEAIEFLKEYNRMCTMYKSCRGCPLEMDNCAGFGDVFSEKQIINIIEKTEQWSKEHHIVTNAQKFKEVFGEKTIDQLALCETRTVGPNVPKLFIKPSSWWDKPYKEP